MYFLGIDGGGTKTKGVITDGHGHVLAEALAGATNPNGVPLQKVEEAFKQLFGQLMNDSGLHANDITQVFAGLSGVSRPDDQQQMRQMLSSLLDGQCEVEVDNDAVTALYSGTLGEPGVVQISGTGSITYGINEGGLHNRVGGWGHFIDKKGSGFTLGKDLLDAVFRAYDGLSGPTSLQEAVLDHFNEKQLPNLIPHIYQSDNLKVTVSGLAKLVFTEADKGDPASCAIITEHAQAIGASIACLIDKHFTRETDDQIPVVLAGGIFNRMDLFHEPIAATLDRHGIDAKLIKPELEPVAGAVVGAITHQHLSIEKQTFFENYQTSMNEVN
ncbi:Glucosamine kinase [Lentibacillus sp. JNUCC-1]|uniref:N-acetylglucosamine kinase n=1 Tax=Lentibacillus sp. JNUCC-1 TaxID=2654513 RepID=UPI001324372B|nr:BadF/BadG/BcrA/BcrD ATPase family protein [Lentibacillus sp. JNUCC-1]MUV39021.1 Glucosamine kinase [Lentibacillus sp. JNUCC-1]